DADSQLIWTTDPNGRTSQRAYDGLGRPLEASVTRGANIAGTTYQAFVWDGLSRLTLSADDNGAAGRGVTAARSFDSVSRVLSEVQQTDLTVTKTGPPTGIAN